MSDESNPKLVGHHQDHAAAIADGSAVPSVDFDFGAFDDVDEMKQGEAEKLAEAFHSVLLWIMDRRLTIAAEDTTKVRKQSRKAIAATGLRAVVLALCLAPELVGNRQLREIARMSGVDEAYIRRLARQIRERWGIKHPFARQSASPPS